MKRTALERGTSKSRSSSTKRSTRRSVRRIPPRSRFVVCVNSGGYVDLEPLKVYKVRHDPDAKAQGLVRVVDASGEDYLYPTSYFRPIQATPRLFKLVEEFA